ncbi:MAG TPA: hypothetical protein VMP00_15270 [Burkholderiales bacterium]|nr:hypothetical protein [Burkholderiales bacterium]
MGFAMAAQAQPESHFDYARSRGHRGKTVFRLELGRDRGIVLDCVGASALCSDVRGRAVHETVRSKERVCGKQRNFGRRATRYRADYLRGDQSARAFDRGRRHGQGAFGRYLHDKEIAKRVEEDLLDGNAAGVSGTPTTLIRNNRTGNIERRIGAVQAESLSQSIERLLGEKR